MNDFEISQSRLHPDGSMCPPCVYLDMARKHANAQGRSLRDAVKHYLLGQVKRTGRNATQVWKGIE